MGVGRFGVGDELEVADPEGAEDLGSCAVFDHLWGQRLSHGVFGVVIVRTREALGELVSDAVGTEVDDRAAALVLDHLHGPAEGLSCR